MELVVVGEVGSFGDVVLYESELSPSDHDEAHHVDLAHLAQATDLILEEVVMLDHVHGDHNSSLFLVLTNIPYLPLILAAHPVDQYSRGSQLLKSNLNFFFERTFSVYYFSPIISHEYFQGFLQIFVIDYPYFFVRNLI